MRNFAGCRFELKTSFQKRALAGSFLDFPQLPLFGLLFKSVDILDDRTSHYHCVFDIKKLFCESDFAVLDGVNNNVFFSDGVRIKEFQEDNIWVHLSASQTNAMPVIQTMDAIAKILVQEAGIQEMYFELDRNEEELDNELEDQDEED